MKYSNGKRAIRRHHIRRLMNNRKDYWGFKAEKKNPGQLKSVVSTPKVCSCSSCCNIRRNPWLCDNEKLTLQERRLDSVRDLLREYNQDQALDQLDLDKEWQEYIKDYQDLEEQFELQELFDAELENYLYDPEPLVSLNSL